MSSPQEMIIKMKDFDATTDVNYMEPRMNARGGKNVAIKTGGGQKLVLQVPLTMTWGANEMVDEQSGRRSYNMNFALDKNSATFKAMKAFEDKVIEDASVNSKKWFGQSNMSAEVIKALFYPVLKYPKDKQSGEIDYDRDPTLKVKLQTWDGEYKFELFDVNNVMLIPNSDNKSPEDFIQKGANIACMLQCGGVWFANGNFGVTWKLSQGIVKPTETLAKGRCHISLSPKDRDEITNDKSGEFKEEDSNNTTNDTLVESDNEEPEQDENDSVEETASNEEDEPEPEPEPEPEKPKKKRVVKKK